MSLPGFIIAGAQKSGTSSLHTMLNQHPKIFMSSPKELHFFDKHFDRGTEWYENCFPPEDAGLKAGESTPYYLYNARARNRMVEVVPGLKVIAILREPVSRAYSHYWHSREKGPEKLQSFDEAVEQEPQRLAKSEDGQPAAFSYIDRGFYLQQLEPLATVIGRERLCVLLMDDLLNQPAETLKGVFTFLSVDPGAASGIELTTVNRFGGGESNRQGEARQRRKRDRSSVPAETYPPIDPATDERLRQMYRPHNERLAQWLGRDLPGWY